MVGARATLKKPQPDDLSVRDLFDQQRRMAASRDPAGEIPGPMEGIRFKDDCLNDC
jgi:hypothetical protein